MGTPKDVLDRRAALRRGGRAPADPDLTRVFDRKVREGDVITLDGADGRVAILEFLRLDDGPGLHLVLRYPAGHRAFGEREGPTRDWRTTVMDKRPGKEAR